MRFCCSDAWIKRPLLSFHAGSVSANHEAQSCLRHALKHPSRSFDSIAAHESRAEFRSSGFEVEHDTHAQCRRQGLHSRNGRIEMLTRL